KGRRSPKAAEAAAEGAEAAAEVAKAAKAAEGTRGVILGVTPGVTVAVPVRQRCGGRPCQEDPHQQCRSEARVAHRSRLVSYAPTSLDLPRARVQLRRDEAPARPCRRDATGGTLRSGSRISRPPNPPPCGRTGASGHPRGRARPALSRRVVGRSRAG